MIELVDKCADTKDPGLRKVLNQMGRELLLMESSDWQFLISTWSARDYAEMRFSEHYNDFKKLLRIVEVIVGGSEPTTGDWELVGDLEKKDTPFPDLDFSLWRDEKGGD